MENKQLLEQIKNIVRAEIEPVNKRLDSIDTRLGNVETTQQQQGQKIDNIDKKLNTFSQIQAQHTTLLEAIGEGQKDQASKKDITEVKIEIQNLGAKQEKILKDQDRRIEDLEDHADIPHHN